MESLLTAELICIVVIGCVSGVYFITWIGSILVLLIAGKHRKTYQHLNENQLIQVRKLDINNIVYGMYCYIWILPSCVFLMISFQKSSVWGVVGFYTCVIGLVFFAALKHNTVKKRRRILSQKCKQSPFNVMPQVLVYKKTWQRIALKALFSLMVVGAIIFYWQAGLVTKNPGNFSVMGADNEGNIKVSKLNHQQQEELLGAFSNDFSSPEMKEFSKTSERYRQEAFEKRLVYHVLALLCMLVGLLCIAMLRVKKRQNVVLETDV
jgi:hypothetical protein